MIKPKETLHFIPPVEVKENGMLGWVDLEVYNSIFDITEENNNFKLYKVTDEKAVGASYEKVRDEIEKDLDISDITATDLQDDIIATIVIEEYREQVTKRMKDVGYMSIVAGYVSSVFQDFESYLGTEVDVVEDDNKLILDKYTSNFITYEVAPGIYTYKDISEALFKILQIEYPGPCNAIVTDITRKTELLAKSGIIATRFDENSFFSTFLGFTPGCDYKHHIEYTSQNILTLNSTNKIHLKTDCIDGSIQNGIRQPIIFVLFWINRPDTKSFVNLKQNNKRLIKSVLNTVTFYLEDDNNEEVHFNGETLTFTLQMIKI